MLRWTQRVRGLVGRVVNDARGPVSQDHMVFVGGLSRSGTTLLTTLLDAHPDVAMGYELVPSVNLRPSLVLAALRAETGSDGLETVGKRLRAQGDVDLGVWLMRCQRAGARLADLQSALSSLHEPRPWGYREQLEMAHAVVGSTQAAARARRVGFKVTGTHFAELLRAFPNAQLVAIVRDPRDVATSQLARNFAGSAASMGEAWRTYVLRLSEILRSHPDRVTAMYYEELVRAPRQTLEPLFARLELELTDSVLAFEESEATVLKGGHPNSAKLRRGFDSSSVQRWRRDACLKDVDTVVSKCGDLMEGLGYGLPPPSARVEAMGTTPLTPSVAMERHAHFERSRKFSIEAYLSLLLQYADTHEVLTHSAYARGPDIGSRPVLLLRHDVDHDYETALRFASWEYSRGLRATYCVLHTAWYYRAQNGEHSRELVDFVQRLHELGHEINFHNNVVATAIRTGVDPAGLLREELQFLRSLGIPITGSSTHGDAICREHEFRNWELFRECCDERFGGPRVLRIEWEGQTREVALGELSMADFGLEYEAYDFPRHLYHTDSGGRMRLRQNTRGRRQIPADEGQVVGVLAHPVWWSIPDTASH